MDDLSPLRETFEEKARRLEQAFFHRFPSGVKHLTLKDIWLQLREDAQALHAGEPFTAAALLPAMRGPSHLFVKDVFVGREVERVSPTMHSLHFLDVLADLAGPHMAIVTSVNDGGNDDKPLLHQHLGEELNVITFGRMKSEWVVWDDRNERFRIVPEPFEMAPEPGHRTTWKKSRIPHRLHRHEAGTREIGFYADALGAHAIHRSAGLHVEGYGVAIVKDQEVDDTNRMWRHMFGIGPRADSIRNAKGIKANDIAPRAHMNHINLSRLESNQRSPTLGEIVSLAYALDVPPSELCPDNLDKTVIKGCYVWPEKDVSAYLGKYESRYRESFGQAAGGAYPPLAFPIRWRDNGLLGSLCSSPRANALVAFHLYFGHSGKKTTDAEYDGAIGLFNDKIVNEPNDRYGGFRSTNAELALLCLEGSIDIEIQRWPEARLFPGLAAKEDAGGSKIETLTPDSLLYIRPRHAFRYLREGRKDEVRLLCVLSSRRGAAGFVELPSPRDIDAMLKSDRAPKRKS